MNDKKTHTCMPGSSLSLHWSWPLVSPCEVLGSVRMSSRSAPWSSISMVMMLPMLSPCWPGLMYPPPALIPFISGWLVELTTGEQTSSIWKQITVVS